MFILFLVYLGGSSGSFKTISPVEFRLIVFCTLLFFAAAAWIFYLQYKSSKALNQAIFWKRIQFAPVLWMAALTGIAIFIVNTFTRDQIFSGQVEVLEDGQPTSLVPTKYFSIEEIIRSADSTFSDSKKHLELIERHFTMPSSALLKDSTVYLRDDVSLLIYYRFNAEDGKEQLTRDIGNFGTGLFYYHKDDHKKALDYLQQVTENQLPSLHYAKARTWLKLGQTDLAMAELEKELSISGFRSRECYLQLIPYLVSRLELEKLMPLAYEKETKFLIPDPVLRELYFRNADFENYIYLTSKLAFQQVNLIGALGALAITIVWAVYLLALDLYRRESVKHVLLALLMGMSFSFLTFPISDLYIFLTDHRLSGSPFPDLLYYIVNVGLVEEVLKLIPLYLLLRFSSIPDEPFDYILYAGIGALGFAFVENLMYFNGQPGGIIHARTLTSVVGHMILSGIAAYGLVLAHYRFKGRSQTGYLLLFLGIGAFLHGLYDFMLQMNLIPIFFFFFLVVAQIWMILVNNALNNSPFFNYEQKPNSSRLQFYTLMALTGIILAEYIMEGFIFGPAQANYDLQSAMFRDSSILCFFAFTLNRLDLHQGYWRGIQVYHPDYADGGMRSAMAPLIANHIRPQNYVGCNISLKPDHRHYSLGARFNQILEGCIKNRVLLFRTKDGSLEKDPYWFLLELNQPITDRKNTSNRLLMKFLESNPSLHEERDVEVILKLIPEGTVIGTGLDSNSLHYLGRAFANEIFIDEAEVIQSNLAKESNTVALLP